MAEDADEIVVNIEDTAHGTNGATVVDANAPDPAVAELKAQYEELQRKDAEREKRLDAERAARADAERRAETSRKEAETARTEVVEHQGDSIASGIAAAEAEANSAEQAYAAAMEAGNFADAAKAQRRMARAEAETVRLNEGKDDLEARKVAPAKGETRTEQRRAPDDPVEAYIQGRSEPTAKWLREHRDWVTDEKKNRKLTAAHWQAVDDNGLKVDTPEYFEFVETQIGLKQPAKTNGATNGATIRTRRASVPVAPVQNSGGGTNGGGTEVVLTRGEAAAATDGTHIWNYDDPSGQKRFKKGEPIGIQEMARRKLKMTEQGLYSKQYTDA